MDLCKNNEESWWKGSKIYRRFENIAVFAKENEVLHGFKSICDIFSNYLEKNVYSKEKNNKMLKNTVFEMNFVLKLLLTNQFIHQKPI